MNSQHPILAALKAAIAFVLLCAGIWMFVDDLAYSRSGTKVEATVTSWHPERRFGGRVDVSFALDGKERHATYHSLFPPLGERVEVLYLPDRPGKVRGSGAWERFGFDALMCLAGPSYLVRGLLTRRSR